jgi:hypothetical protein
MYTRSTRCSSSRAPPPAHNERPRCCRYTRTKTMSSNGREHRRTLDVSRDSPVIVDPAKMSIDNVPRARGFIFFSPGVYPGEHRSSLRPRANTKTRNVSLCCCLGTRSERATFKSISFSIQYLPPDTIFSFPC